MPVLYRREYSRGESTLEERVVPNGDTIKPAGDELYLDERVGCL